jgi:hypothetical protein
VVGPGFDSRLKYIVPFLIVCRKFPCFLCGRSRYRLSARRPVILIDGFREFLQIFQADVKKVTLYRLQPLSSTSIQFILYNNPLVRSYELLKFRLKLYFSEMYSGNIHSILRVLVFGMQYAVLLYCLLQQQCDRSPFCFILSIPGRLGMLSVDHIQGSVDFKYSFTVRIFCNCTYVRILLLSSRQSDNYKVFLCQVLFYKEIQAYVSCPCMRLR